MARPKNATNYSHTVRVAFQRAIDERYGPEGWRKAWLEVMEKDGMARAFQLFAHFVPAEMHIETERDTTIPAIGVVPATAQEWAEQFGAKPAITVDSESGEVLQ